VEGRRLLPGFVDVHVHGGGGHDAMSGTREALEGMSKFHARHGTTSFLATTVCAPEKELLNVVRCAKEAAGSRMPGAELLGVHLEGPFLNVVRGGAQNPAYVRPMNPEEMQRYLDEAGGNVRLVTLAPELTGAEEIIRYLRSRDVTVSAGHTDATFEEMELAVRWGVTHVTHQFNGQRPFHHREPGAAGAGLLLPELTIELIADGIHLHPGTIALAFAAKPEDRIAFVTDAVLCAGCPDGEYELEGLPVKLDDGAVMLLNGGGLAGSTLTMNRAFGNVLRFTGLPMERVLPGFTHVPARQIGMDRRKGKLQPGADADFILVDDDGEISRTFVRGVEVYSRH
jgi:N-acetylglucosamine-6-phosphate deacetylase